MSTTTNAVFAGSITSKGCARPVRVVTRSTRSAGIDHSCMVVLLRGSQHCSNFCADDARRCLRTVGRSGRSGADHLLGACACFLATVRGEPWPVAPDVIEASEMSRLSVPAAWHAGCTARGTKQGKGVAMIRMALGLLLWTVVSAGVTLSSASAADK